MSGSLWGTSGLRYRLEPPPHEPESRTLGFLSVPVTGRTPISASDLLDVPCGWSTFRFKGGSREKFTYAQTDPGGMGSS